MKIVKIATFLTFYLSEPFRSKIILKISPKPLDNNTKTRYNVFREVKLMKEKEIIKEAMKTCGWNQEQLALACGYKTQSAIGNRLSGNSMRVDTFVKLLSAMGYEVVVKSVSPRTNKNEWAVDGGDEK